MKSTKNLALSSVMAGLFVANPSFAANPSDGITNLINEIAPTAAVTAPGLVPMIQHIQAQEDKNYHRVLSSFNPIHHNGLNQVARHHVTQAIHTTGDRLESIRLGVVKRDHALSAGDWDTGFGAWVQLFGSDLTQLRRNEVEGYDAHTFGFTLGLDKEFAQDFWLGLGLSYAYSNIDSRQFKLSNVDLQSYQAFLYSSWRLTQGWYWDLFGSMTYHDYNTVRFISAPAVGALSGLSYRAEGGLSAFESAFWTESGYELIYKLWMLTPFVNYQFGHLNMHSLQEQKAGPYNLNIRYKDTDASILGGGLRLGLIMEMDDQVVLMPQLKAEVRHDFINDDLQSTANFAGGGPNFVTRGLKPAPTSYLFGFGAKLADQDAWSIQLQYDYEMKPAFHAHHGWLKFRVDWL